MKKLRILLVAACAAAFCFALAGCGGGGGGATDTSAFLGEWSISSMTADGEDVVSAEDLETMKSMGMDVTFTVNEDGTCALNMFGEAMEGEWAPGSGGIDVTIQGQTIPATLDNGNLTMEQQGQKLVFAKK